VILFSLLPLPQVEGIVGTYIANRKTPGSQYGATVISFDKGGAWNFLTPPAVTSGGTPIICSPVSESTSSPLYLHSHCILLSQHTHLHQPQCSLHLHMNSDQLYGYQSILSLDSAIGLIMAQGEPSDLATCVARVTMLCCVNILCILPLN